MRFPREGPVMPIAAAMRNESRQSGIVRPISWANIGVSYSDAPLWVEAHRSKLVITYTEGLAEAEGLGLGDVVIPSAALRVAKAVLRVVRNSVFAAIIAAW